MQGKGEPEEDEEEKVKGVTEGAKEVQREGGGAEEVQLAGEA